MRVKKRGVIFYIEAQKFVGYYHEQNCCFYSHNSPTKSWDEALVPDSGAAIMTKISSPFHSKVSRDKPEGVGLILDIQISDKNEKMV